MAQKINLCPRLLKCYSYFTDKGTDRCPQSSLPEAPRLTAGGTGAQQGSEGQQQDEAPCSPALPAWCQGGDTEA